MTSGLTDRWRPARLSPAQHGFLTSRSRVNAVVAGRRSFKTEGAKRRLIMAAIRFTQFSDGQFFACAPTHGQAKSIFWKDLKALTPTWALKNQNRRRAISDGELTIDLVNGAQIKVVGLDKPERIEGRDWDGGVISEFGNCKPDIFQAHIRPMMTRGGWIDLEGVPEGRNHWYEMAMKLRDESSSSSAKRISSAYHHWTTEEVLHLWLGEEGAAAELDEAKSSMDKLVYQQEYLANFVAFEGMAYHAFSDSNKAYGDNRALYDPREPLILCFDFNREPGVCVYVQEQDAARFSWIPKLNPKHGKITACIGEVYIKRASNTRKVCRQILNDWQEVHTSGEVMLYGDPAGGAKTSSAVDGSDWDLIKEALEPAFGRRLRDRVPKAAPRVRARLNAVNSRLETAAGRVGLVVDAKACPILIRDFEGVEADAQGNLIKVPGGPLTHLTDALGYYIHEAHPCGGPVFRVEH